MSTFVTKFMKHTEKKQGGLTKLPDPSTIPPLDPEEFLAAHDYAGMVMENEFLEEVPSIGRPFINTPDGLIGFTKQPINLFAMAVPTVTRKITVYLGTPPAMSERAIAI